MADLEKNKAGCVRVCVCVSGFRWSEHPASSGGPIGAKMV